MDIYSSKLSPAVDIGAGIFLFIIGKFLFASVLLVVEILEMLFTGL